MINSQDIKKGTCIRLDGKLYFCVDFLHVKPGKGNTIMRTTLKDVVKGGQIERRFNIGEKLVDASETTSTISPSFMKSTPLIKFLSMITSSNVSWFMK